MELSNAIHKGRLVLYVLLAISLGFAVHYLWEKEPTFDEQVAALDVVFFPAGERNEYIAWSRKQEKIVYLKNGGRESCIWVLPTLTKYPMGV